MPPCQEPPRGAKKGPHELQDAVDTTLHDFDGTPLTGAERVLSTELWMMAYRLSDEQPKPPDYNEHWLARWCFSVYRVVQGRYGAPASTISLFICYFGVVLWLLQQNTLKGLYHSATDVGAAFAVVYCNAFLMVYRTELFQRVREAAIIAGEIEDQQGMSEEIAADVRQTTRLVQVIFAVGTSHAYSMFVLFMIPTLLKGESPSPLVRRDTVPLYLRYFLYITQSLSVAAGDSCLMMMEYVHLGTTLTASLMYRMIAARFASGKPISLPQLYKLVSLHQRLIDNTHALQERLSVTVLLMLSSAVIGLAASTLSVMDSNTEMYMYLTFVSTAFYIVMKCGAGDQLLSWSRELANQVYCCPWPSNSRSFCTTVTLIIARAQKPQIVNARYVGQLDIPTARNIFNRWYTFVQYLQNSVSSGNK